MGETFTEETPLNVAEQHFLANYIKTGSLIEAVLATPELQDKALGKTRNEMSKIGSNIMSRPHVKAEYERAINEARQSTMASATEVMEYFTQVMRGEIKDQFGLDASLAERTRAAQELAKRTIDIQNRQNGTADQTIEIKLDWSR